MSHIAQRRVPYFRLLVADAFKRLTPSERRYAHHLNNAGWHGASVCAAQLSVESPGILRLFHTLFAVNSLDQLKASSGVSQDEFDCFVEYAALVYSNLGNHLSFGDSKFIPACTPETFAKIVSSAAAKKEETDALFAAVNEAIYSTHESELILGHAPGGRSAYYGGGITKAEIERVDGLLTSRRIEQWNTRVFKVGEGQYEVRIPCAEPRREVLSAEADFHVTLVFGDFAEHFARIVKEFELALPFAQTPEQKTMIAAYIEHFKHGRIEDHKASQIAWVQDKGPAVETNIGFIETYRDPQGVRAEWEGFVAVVNKDQSKKYAELVRRGPEFIVELPWGADFEKETFANPDFTSLEVLGFASSGVPLGICIPNYDDVRTHNGFKNVTLANSASAINFDDKMNHVTDADWALYREHFLASMSVGVGIHELLGHGTGKLFYQNEDGSYNFKHGSVVNPLTGAPVTTCYKPGETWGALFKDVANAYEECRAEAVALYLSLNRDILKIFGKETDKEAHETVHVLWLNMVRGGLVGLEFYTPEQKKWRQAHVRARYCILQTLLRCPRPLVTIDHDPANGKLDITIDSSRIATDGKAAIGELLRHLNINKAIGDVEAGRSFFERFTAVDEEFEAIRTTVLRLAKPRKQFVQPHTRLTESGDVELLEFAPNAVGAIDAFVARHRDIPL